MVAFFCEKKNLSINAIHGHSMQFDAAEPNPHNDTSAQPPEKGDPDEATTLCSYDRSTVWARLEPSIVIIGG